MPTFFKELRALSDIFQRMLEKQSNVQRASRTAKEVISGLKVNDT